MVKILVASSVRQKKAILEQFLFSLYDLNLNGLRVDYAFVDDNDDEHASNLLRHFRPLESRVWFFEVEHDQESYLRDEANHYWNSRLVSRVAGNKDLLLKHAIREQYDHILLLDSDLLLHPETLLHLISCKRDIISEVFWTRWQDTQELPNVWLMDEYKFYRAERGVILDNNEDTLHSMNFLNQLRKPGIYKVGGLGACTLISQKALVNGVSYQYIYNLSFQGEDRHFCVRAVALGFELYADTHYPCYHIYRDNDLQGIAGFIKSVPQRSAAALSHIVGSMVNDILTSYRNVNDHLISDKISTNRYFTEAGWLSFNSWLQVENHINHEKIGLIQVNKPIIARDAGEAIMSVKLRSQSEDPNEVDSNEEIIELHLVRKIDWRIYRWVSKG